MNAVALLTLAFVAIAVVGTALAALHDVIAAAIARADVDAAAVQADRRPVSATVSRNRYERPLSRTTPAQATTRVRVRSVDGAAAPGAGV